MIVVIVSVGMPPITSSLGRENERSVRPTLMRRSNGNGSEVIPVSARLSNRMAVASPSATPQVGCCGGDEGNDKPHLLAGSFYTLRNDFSAKLLLNNKGPVPIEVQPTLFSLGGESFAIPIVAVAANAHRFIDLRDWVSLAGEQFREGSLQLFHRGKDLVLGAQIYLTDEMHSLTFEEKLTELGKGSSRLEGVWWLPSPKGEVKLVLSNTTEAALSVSVKIQGEKPKKEATATFDLRPHETKVTDVQADILEPKHGAMSTVGAISVQHNGAAGAVLARAMALDMDNGYSLPIQFSNPAGAKSNNLQGAGLRVAKIGGEPLSARVVLHNASAAEMMVNGRLLVYGTQ